MKEFLTRVFFSAAKRPRKGKDKKPKPVREESFSPRPFFEHNDFSYIDGMVDHDRKDRDGVQGMPFLCLQGHPVAVPVQYGQRTRPGETPERTSGLARPPGPKEAFGEEDGVQSPRPASTALR